MSKPLRYLSPLHKASRQIGMHFEQTMARTGLAPVEGHLLSYLRSYAPCPIAEVLNVFGLRGSTATSMLDRLEEKGVIERVPNPDDRRSFLLQLTREGKRVAEHVQQFVDELEGMIANRVTSEEERGFRAVLDAIGEVTGMTVVNRDATPSRTPGAPRAPSRRR